MTTDPDRSFVDTNVLIYAATPAATQHSACRQLLESSLRLCLSPQVLSEFYSVTTNRRRVAVPFTPSEAGSFVSVLLSRIDVLPVTVDTVRRWVKLGQQYSSLGADIFDVQIAATMIENGVSRIYTYNSDDFAVFPELEVITP
jgi:predicted nucleic acid-binding protein